MRPRGKPVAAAGGVHQLLDSELADLLVLKLRQLRQQDVGLVRALRTDTELDNILAEFRRRAQAHAAARERYRSRWQKNRGPEAA